MRTFGVSHDAYFSIKTTAIIVIAINIRDTMDIMWGFGRCWYELVNKPICELYRMPVQRKGKQFLTFCEKRKKKIR